MGTDDVNPRLDRDITLLFSSSNKKRKRTTNNKQRRSISIFLFLYCSVHSHKKQMKKLSSLAKVSLLLSSVIQAFSPPPPPSNRNMSSFQKTIKEICRKPPSHWVGDGFHVFPGI